MPPSDDYPGFEVREVHARAAFFRRRAQQWYEALLKRMARPHVYQVNAGCACLFLSDGENADDPERMTAMAALRRYVELALESGSVSLLICWAGDERKPGEFQHLRRTEIGHLDFDSAWDRPLLISVE
ncbi:MAG TPA: hypothetical protein VGV93_03670 [Acidimicrobiales bacterium]|nr:hypothetical protein [Acidimicrobiales bacterium]